MNLIKYPQQGLFGKALALWAAFVFSASLLISNSASADTAVVAALGCSSPVLGNDVIGITIDGNFFDTSQDIASAAWELEIDKEYTVYCTNMFLGAPDGQCNFEFFTGDPSVEVFNDLYGYRTNGVMNTWRFVDGNSKTFHIVVRRIQVAIEGEVPGSDGVYHLPCSVKTIRQACVVQPSVASPPYTWTVSDTNLATIDANGLLALGQDPGMFTVRATSTNGYFGEALVDSRRCASCNCPMADNNSVDVSIPMGWSFYGDSAGALSIKAETPDSSIATPQGLNYKYFKPDVSVVRDTNGVLQQVLAPQTFANIVVVSGSKYQVELRHNTDVIGTTNGLFVYTNTPFRIVTVENLSGDTNQVRVTDSIDGADNISDFVWTGANWELTTGAGLSKSIRTKVTVGNVRTETATIKNSGGATVSQDITEYTISSYGQRITKEISGTGANALTNSYSYTSVGLVQQEISGDGSWRYYVYDGQNRPTNVFSGFLNQGVTTDRSLCRLEANDYSTNDVSGSGDNGTREPDMPRMTIQYLLGQEIGRTYHVYLTFETHDIQCTTPGAAWNDTNNLVTITKFFPGFDNQGMVQSVIRPDGTATSYGYDFDFYGNQVRIVSTGHPDATGTNIDNGTANLTFIDPTGLTLSHQTMDLPTGLLLSEEDYYYDSLHRLTNTIYLDDTSSSITYDCCNIAAQTDRDETATYFTHDALKRLVTTTRNGIVTSNALDAAGNTLQTVRFGTDGSAITNQTSVYDLAGRLVASADALGNTTVYTNYVDGSGQNIRQTTFPDLSTRVETSARDGSLLKVDGTAVHSVRYDYGVGDDGSGVQRSYSKAIPVNTNGSDTAEWTKSYTDFAGRSFKTLFADGATNTTFYNSAGQVAWTIDPDGVTQLYQYNSKGEVEYTAIDIDQNGAIDFGGADRITRTTNDVTAFQDTFARRSRTYEWTSSGVDAPLLTSTTYQEITGRRTWSMQYGLTNYTETDILGGGIQRSLQIAPDGSQTISSNVNGRAISVASFDSQGNPLSAISFSYDAHGRQSGVTDARNGTTTTTYTAADQPQTMTTPAPAPGQSAQVTTSYYDNRGRNWKTTLPDSTSVTNEFFITGELKKTYGSRTYPVEYTYDYSGRMKTMKTWQSFSGNSGTATTTWNYDAARGSIAGKAYADGKGPIYTNTPAGRLHSRTWARGITTLYAYDTAGQLTNALYSDSTPAASYVYDRRGRMIQSTCLGTDTLTYNDAGLPLADDYLVNSLNFSSQLRYGYDALLRRTSLANLSLGSSIAYGYDAASRLASVSEGTNNASYSYVSNSSLVGQIVFKQGASTRLTTTKGYDALNRLTNILNSAATTLSSDYRYNLANQRTNQLREDGTYWVYQYDSLGQVTTGKKYWADGTAVAGQQFEYAFDDIGNRTSTKAGGDAAGANLRTATYNVNPLNQYTNRTVPGYLEVQGDANTNATVTVNSTNAYRYGAYYRQELAVNNSSSPVYQTITNQGVLTPDTVTLNRHTLVAATPEPFTYDDDGNLLSDGKWNYTWDGENRLLAIQSLSSIPDIAKHRMEYSYDGQGRRIYAKQMSWTGSTYRLADEERYWYDGWNLIGRASLTGLLQTYCWGLDLSGSMQGAGGVGGLLWLTSQSTVNAQPATYFYGYDGNGNVKNLLSAHDGSVAANYEYGPFGELLRGDGIMATLNPFRFSTKFQDAGSDLVYYGCRFYDATLGKWLSRDPIEEEGGEDLYGMVENNPQAKYDFLGLEPTELHHIIPEWLANYTAYGPRAQGLCIRLTQEFHRGSGGLESELTQIRMLLRNGTINQFQAYNRVLLAQLRNLPAIFRDNRRAVGGTGAEAWVFRGAIRAALAQVGYFSWADAALGATGIGTVAIGGVYLTDKTLELGAYNNMNIEGQSEIDLYNSRVTIASRASRFDADAILSATKDIARCQNNASSPCVQKFKAALSRSYFVIQTMGIEQSGVSVKEARNIVSEQIFLQYIQCLEDAGCCLSCGQKN